MSLGALAPIERFEVAFTRSDESGFFWNFSEISELRIPYPSFESSGVGEVAFFAALHCAGRRSKQSLTIERRLRAFFVTSTNFAVTGS